MERAGVIALLRTPERALRDWRSILSAQTMRGSGGKRPAQPVRFTRPRRVACLSAPSGYRQSLSVTVIGTRGDGSSAQGPVSASCREACLPIRTGRPECLSAGPRMTGPDRASWTLMSEKHR